MKKEIRFNSPAPPAETNLLIRTYFWKNGYYELNSASGLRFAKSGGSDILLSPQRLDLKIEVHLQPKGTGTEVYQVIHPKADPVYITVIDKEYLAAFQEHFRNAVLSGKTEMFPFRQYDKQLRSHSRTFLILSALAVMVGLVLAAIWGIVPLVGFIVLAAPMLVMGVMNRQMAKESKKAR